MTDPLKAPFPYFGGKSKVADLVWSRLGNVENFIEPFMGSAAVLLRRPADHFRGRYRVETANDANGFLTNFWRAVAADPEQVARWADSPVCEHDLHARHRWLMRSQKAADWRRWMAEDPEHYDAKVAGWWVWGACCWIGSGWCSDGREPGAQIVDLGGGFGGGRAVHTMSVKMPHMDAAGRGVAGRGVAAPGLSQQLPDMDTGRGNGRPQLTDAFDIGRGVNGGAASLSQQLPHMTNAGQGVNALPGGGTYSSRRAWLVEWMQRLSDRLRIVRTCYGHWSRVCDSDSTLTRLGTTGVFLDPPYPLNRSDTGEDSRADALYATDNGSDLNALRDEVLAWCVKWGGDKAIRIAVCGYEGDGYESLAAEHGWDEHEWEASGGYGNQTKGKGKAENAKRERIWFSPACLQRQKTLLDFLEVEQGEPDRVTVNMPEPNQVAVHATHCCRRCGCKYGDESCPVTAGTVGGIRPEHCDGGCEAEETPAEPSPPPGPSPVTDVYADGGCVLDNPSPHGGTWAWCHVAGGGRVAEASGAVTPEEVGTETVSNNATEFLALLLCLEALPNGWAGTASTDSGVTLLRFRDHTTTKMKGIPDAWVVRLNAVRRRLGELNFVLLGGHPTRAELAAGVRKDGKPVSEHNVWADKQCGKRAKELLSTPAGAPA